MPLRLLTPGLDPFVVESFSNLLVAQSLPSPALHSPENLLLLRLLMQPPLDALIPIRHQAQRMPLGFLMLEDCRGPLRDELALHLRHGTHDRQKETTHRSVSVDLLMRVVRASRSTRIPRQRRSIRDDGEEPCVALLEDVFDQVEEVACVSCESIELEDHQGLGLLSFDQIQEFLEAWSVQILPRKGISKIRP